jgi:hypothetical protein
MVESSRNRKLLTVYRIGQLKPVHVYYPIAKDPQREFGTLQEKLDTLLERSSSGGTRSSR